MAQTFSSPPPEWGGGEDIGLHLADFTLLDTFFTKNACFPPLKYLTALQRKKNLLKKTRLHVLYELCME